MKIVTLSNEQLSSLKEVLGEERKFFISLCDRVDAGFYGDIEGFNKKVHETSSDITSILYDINYNKKTFFQGKDLNCIKNVVEMHYRMQRLFVEKFKNQIWWSEGRPDDATSDSLEQGVPEEHLRKRDVLKELLDTLS